MDFYGEEEETPLLRSIHVRGGADDAAALSPKDGSEPPSPAPQPANYLSTASSATTGSSLASVSASARGWRRRVLQAPEFQLSADKVSFLFSPKPSGGGAKAGGAGFDAGADADADATDYEDDELAILDPYFDVTDSRLQAAFEEAGPDGKRDAQPQLRGSRR